jgi:hypothetical protein
MSRTMVDLETFSRLLRHIAITKFIHIGPLLTHQNFYPERGTHMIMHHGSKHSFMIMAESMFASTNLQIDHFPGMAYKKHLSPNLRHLPY